jgi:hypothetical protein
MIETIKIIGWIFAGIIGIGIIGYLAFFLFLLFIFRQPKPNKNSEIKSEKSD